MAFNIFRRSRKLRAIPPSDIGDIYVGSFVRVAWGGGPLGLVVWVREAAGTAGVHWDNQAPGLCEIIQIKFLRPEAGNPAFGPDVRGE